MKNINKIVAGSLTMISLMALSPISVHADWKKDSTGWWYTEGNSWATGWRQINGAEYFFDNNGYMVEDKVVDGYYLNSSGVGIGCLTREGLIIEKSTGIVMKFSRRDAKCAPGQPELSIVIPEEVDGVKIKGIGNNAFSICTNIESVTIPEGVTSIGSRAFSDCMSLKNVTIPNSVTSIGENAFCACKNAIFYVRNDEIKQLLINSNIDSSKIVVKQ